MAPYPSFGCGAQWWLIDGTRSSTSTRWRCLLSLWRSGEGPVTHCWWVPVSPTSVHDVSLDDKGQEFVCQVESPGAPHSGSQSGCRSHPRPRLDNQQMELCGLRGPQI